MITITAAWLGPGSKSFDILRICSAAAIIALFYLYYGDITIENDFWLDTQWAEALLGPDSMRGNPAFYQAELGMPLIVLLSGYTFSHSLFGVIIIQTLMAIFLPVLTYLTLRPWFPRAAYFTALASTLSLAPFLLMKLANHDEPYLFFMMLSVYLFNRYIRFRRPTDLYTTTFSTIMTALMRMVGRATYPFLVLACLLEKPKGNYKHLVLSILIFIAVNVAYSNYRKSMLGDLPVVGIQTFENVYEESATFGVRLSPDFGPHVKLFIDSAYQCSLPSPAKGKIRKLLPSGSMGDDDIAKYTADELQNKFFTTPNFTYYFALTGCLDGDLSHRDHVLLMAALETARARPLLILDYVASNLWGLLFDPGWVHPQHTTLAVVRAGLLFPFGGATTSGRGTFGNSLVSPRAIQEASFIPLVRQPKAVQTIYLAIESAWARSYHPISAALGILTCVTWSSTMIGLLSRLFRNRALAHGSKLLLADQVIPASLGASMFLITNMAPTAIFGYPLYRYDFSMLMLKFILAGIGCVILVNIYRAVVRPLAGVPALGKSSASLQ